MIRPTPITTQRPGRPRELEIALFCIIILSGVYVAYEMVAEPAGGHPFGHWLGIIGATLMVMTETLYSLRKRTRLFNRLGPVRHWLSFHIVTGLVGPFLVLMHTGFAFRGLAGFTFWLTVVVVVSGFIGRYLYTTLNRSISHATFSRGQVALDLQQAMAELASWEAEKPRRVREIAVGLQGNYGTGRLERWRYRRKLQQTLVELERAEIILRRQVEQLEQRDQRLIQQQARLDRTRAIFRLWHTIHIPLGITLFVSLAIHIGATIFFRAGLF